MFFCLTKRKDWCTPNSCQCVHVVLVSDFSAREKHVAYSGHIVHVIYTVLILYNLLTSLNTLAVIKKTPLVKLSCVHFHNNV